MRAGIRLHSRVPEIHRRVGDIDADGRIWVVEMRGYMPTLDGRGEREPVGRITGLDDTDDDARPS